MNRPLIALGLALILGVMGWQIAAKERTLADGTRALFELAPVDPRSLMQGDYMVLTYAISRESKACDRLTYDAPEQADGRLVVALDGDGVARLVRIDDGRPLAAGELPIRYRCRRGRLRLGAESYFFEEGTAAIYEEARYGGLRVAPDGNSVLIGLYDADRAPLGVTPAD